MLKAKAAQVISKLWYWIGTGGGSKPTPPDNNFQSPVWGSSSTSGRVKPPQPPDKSNPACKWTSGYFIFALLDPPVTALACVTRGSLLFVTALFSMRSGSVDKFLFNWCYSVVICYIFMYFNFYRNFTEMLVSKMFLWRSQDYKWHFGLQSNNLFFYMLKVFPPFVWKSFIHWHTAFRIMIVSLNFSSAFLF